MLDMPTSFNPRRPTRRRVMTIVIPFAPTRAALRRRAASEAPDAVASGAAILFFTGVRYERQPQAALPEEPAPRKRRVEAAGKRPVRRAAAGQTV
jgi:hypothetical protein